MNIKLGIAVNCRRGLDGGELKVMRFIVLVYIGGKLRHIPQFLEMLVDPNLIL